MTNRIRNKPIKNANICPCHSAGFEHDFVHWFADALYRRFRVSAMQAITMSSKEKCWQGSEQMGITSKEFFGQKHRVVRYCHSRENSMQWQRAVRSRLYSEWAREGYCNLFTLVGLSNLILLSVNTSNTLSLNGVYSFREQNNPHPPLSPPFKVGLVVVFYK